MERRRGQDTPNYFMRVRVALSVSKPLRRGGFIEDSDGNALGSNLNMKGYRCFVITVVFLGMTYATVQAIMQLRNRG